MSSWETSGRQARLSNLARAVRAWSDEAAHRQTPFPPALAEVVARNIGTGRPGRRIRPLVAMTAGAAVAVGVLVLLRGLASEEARLTFAVFDEVATSGEGTNVEGPGPRNPNLRSSVAGTVSSGARETRVAFSDGSTVVLRPDTRGIVVRTTERGAEVRLEQGRARFSIAHRAQTEWAVEAGPFVVVVHGTVFDVSWSEKTGALMVDLFAGAVTVQGPEGSFPGGDRQARLQPGQRLTANAPLGAKSIETTVTDMGTVETAGVSTAAMATNSPTPPAPTLTVPTGAPAAREMAFERAPPSSSPQQALAATSRRVLAAKSPGAAPSSRRDWQVAPGLSARDRAPLTAMAAAWPKRVASGAFASVVADAETLGVEHCLAEADVGALGALADAARYVHRPGLARQALLAQRRRFPTHRSAHDAAFLLGRLAEDATGDGPLAVLWYDLYLEEGGRGSYAAEALGRKMLALTRLGSMVDAQRAAQRYLDRYAEGPFAARARQLLAR